MFRSSSSAKSARHRKFSTGIFSIFGRRRATPQWPAHEFLENSALRARLLPVRAILAALEGNIDVPLAMLPGFGA
jgi:hypothetical protein